MNFKKLQFVYTSIICLVAYFVFSSNSGGMPGVAATGCGGASCHTLGNTTMTLTSTIPGTGWVANTTYTMTLTVTNANVNKVEAGFDIVCSTGIIASIGGQNTTAVGTSELIHSMPKAMTGGSAVWDFSWTAPAAGTVVTFPVSGNAVDGNNQSSNDEFNMTAFSFNSATAVNPPTINNVSATNITTSGAMINGIVNANNDPASVTVQYGTTISYGQTAATTPGVVTGISPTPVSATLSGLNPGTLYHYRLSAVNVAGTTNDIDHTFTTLGGSSVNDIENTAIRIYPNPVQDVLVYENKENKHDVRFTLLDLLGNHIRINALKTADGKYSIDTRALSKGFYVLMMNLDGKSFQHTISK